MVYGVCVCVCMVYGVWCMVYGACIYLYIYNNDMDKPYFWVISFKSTGLADLSKMNIDPARSSGLGTYSFPPCQHLPQGKRFMDPGMSKICVTQTIMTLGSSK